jgi:hypothetical protein
LDDIEEQNLGIDEQKSTGEESHNQSDKPVNEESNNQSDKPVNLVMPEQTAQDLATDTVQAQDLATDTVQAGKQDAAGPPKKKLRLGQTRETLPY